LLEDSASNFYKYIVNEKVDHIDNVIFGVLFLAISVIFNKISIQSMTTIYEYRLLPDLARKEYVARSLSRDLSLGCGILV